jgi:hypothetical protein
VEGVNKIKNEEQDYEQSIQYMSANITLPPQEQFLNAQYIHIDTVIAKSIPEYPHANFCQGRYGISIPEIGRFLTPRGTKTLTPESTNP